MWLFWLALDSLVIGFLVPSTLHIAFQNVFCETQVLGRSRLFHHQCVSKDLILCDQRNTHTLCVLDGSPILAGWLIQNYHLYAVFRIESILTSFPICELPWGIWISTLDPAHKTRDGSSRNLPSTVTISDVKIAHREPLTLEILNTSSSVLAPSPFHKELNYGVVSSSWVWDDIILSYLRCNTNPVY